MILTPDLLITFEIDSPPGHLLIYCNSRKCAYFMISCVIWIGSPTLTEAEIETNHKTSYFHCQGAPVSIKQIDLLTHKDLYLNPSSRCCKCNCYAIKLGLGLDTEIHWSFPTLKYNSFEFIRFINKNFQQFPRPTDWLSSTWRWPGEGFFRRWWRCLRYLTRGRLKLQWQKFEISVSVASKNNETFCYELQFGHDRDPWGKNIQLEMNLGSWPYADLEKMKTRIEVGTRLILNFIILNAQGLLFFNWNIFEEIIWRGSRWFNTQNLFIFMYLNLIE